MHTKGANALPNDEVHSQMIINVSQRLDASPKVWLILQVKYDFCWAGQKANFTLNINSLDWNLPIKSAHLKMVGAIKTIQSGNFLATDCL